MKTITPLIVGLLLSLACAGCFELQRSQDLLLTGDVKHLEQNWTQEQRNQFYHASQGTVMMEADWFDALEQPELKFLGKIHLFRDSQYLARFGFLPDAESPTNPRGLPIGFAVSDIVHPDNGEQQTVVGLTCAACHTGELNYGSQRIRIDGATAMVDLAKFQKALGAATFLTARVPTRFDRFAHRVLGKDHTESQRVELRERLEQFLNAGRAEKHEKVKREIFDVHDGGFGRTDALAKIGNFVFGTQLDDDNLRVGDAPVRFPPLWDTPWFDWSQYNGSVAQPMVRNIGEALGVRARINLDPNSERFMDSTVDIDGLYEIEKLLSGDAALQGLQSPRWPVSVFGELNPIRVARGKKIYEFSCQKCHLPALESEEIWKDDYWVDNRDRSMIYNFEAPSCNERFLNLNGVNLGEIGTDPGQATNFFGRYVNTGDTILPSPTKGMWDPDQKKWVGPAWHDSYAADDVSKNRPTSIIPVGVALQRITVALAERHFDKLGLDRDERMKRSGNRLPAARSPLEYRPRPLNGIWASPPFLHNGSVRTIYQLLSPMEERDTVFYTGTRQYDPVEMGYKNIKQHGSFRFDTRVQGNRNTGHLFDRKTEGRPVIGPRLSKEDRYDVMEYLKSLGPANPQPESDDDRSEGKCR